MIEIEGAASEMEKRTNKWKQQEPVIKIVSTLALGMRKMRPELRRRVYAWNELTILACHSARDISDEHRSQTNAIAQDEECPTTQTRIPLHAKF